MKPNAAAVDVVAAMEMEMETETKTKTSKMKSSNSNNKLCEGKSEVLTEINFFNAELIENKLHDPDQSGRVRYSGVGVFQGKDLDLVITQTPDSPSYSTFRPNKNGFNCIDYPDETCKNFGNIHIETLDPRNKTVTQDDIKLMDGKATFDFCFMYANSEELATVDSFDWTVFDLDYRQNGGLQEKFTMDVSQAQSYSVSSNSELKMWCEDDGPASAVKDGTFTYEYIDYGDNEKKKTRTGPHYAPPSCDDRVRTVFHSRYEGRTQDNPTDPKSMTDIAIARSIEFRFENTSCWTFKYEHYCPCSNSNGDSDSIESYCDEEGGFSDNGDICVRIVSNRIKSN